MRSRWLGSAALLGGVVLLAAGEGFAQPPGGGGFPGGGFPGGGGGFPGGPPGGGFGGRGGMPDPETIWGFMGGAGKDSIDLNQNPQLKAMMERRGEALPPNGILTKQQFIEGMQRRMAARPGGGMGGPPGGAPGGPPMGFNQGGPGGFGRPRFEGGPGGGGFPGGPPGGGWGGPGGGGGWNGQGGPPGQPGQPGPDGQGGGKDDGKKKDAEPDFTQIGIRYGKLPPGLPGWFTELDTDKDGQVGLDEWRADGRKTDEFAALDADGDWLLSPRELLRADAIKADERRLTAAAEGSDASPTRGPGGRPGAGAPPGKGGGSDGPPGKGGNRGQWSGKKDRGKN